MTSLLTRSSLPWTVSAEGNNARNLQAKDTYTQTYVIIFCAFSGAILLLLLLNAFLRFRRRNEILRQRQALQHAQANPTPLDEKEIEAKKEFIMTLLPIKTFTVENTANNHELLEENKNEAATSAACSICLEAFQVSDELRGSNNTQCRHVFHSSCIIKWLIQNDSHLVCPMCRCDFEAES